MDQLILGFALLGLRTSQRISKTTKKAGIVVTSNSTSTFLSFVQFIGCRTAMVVFTCCAKLQALKFYIKLVSCRRLISYMKLHANMTGRKERLPANFLHFGL